jgi:hypothetical protein
VEGGDSTSRYRSGRSPDWMLSPDQYEIVDVRTSRGVRRAILFTKAILQAEFAANAPLREALAIKRERLRAARAKRTAERAAKQRSILRFKPVGASTGASGTAAGPEYPVSENNARATASMAPGVTRSVTRRPFLGISQQICQIPVRAYNSCERSPI